MCNEESTGGENEDTDDTDGGCENGCGVKLLDIVCTEESTGGERVVDGTSAMWDDSSGEFLSDVCKWCTASWIRFRSSSACWGL